MLVGMSGWVGMGDSGSIKGLNSDERRMTKDEQLFRPSSFVFRQYLNFLAPDPPPAPGGQAQPGPADPGTLGRWPRDGRRVGPGVEVKHLAVDVVAEQTQGGQG